jgi:hypothetical protein
MRETLEDFFFKKVGEQPGSRFVDDSPAKAS